MLGVQRALVAVMAILVMPAVAVEATYLDTAPVKNPGEYLAPADFYMRVPPPSVSFTPGGSLVPATVFDTNVTLSKDTVAANSGSGGFAGPASTLDNADEPREKILRVLLKAGLDHASDVPLAVMREHLAEVENIELVSDGQQHDVLVEVETMKLASTATVFIVVNASKEVDDEMLIFYNNFGYMGELKLLSGAASYAASLEAALEQEADAQED